MSKASETTFISLPREIRETIYIFALVDCHSLVQPLPRFLPAKRPTLLPGYVQCNHRQDIGIGMRVQGLVPLLVLLHEWASKSSIAREACVAFYTNTVFSISLTLLPHLLDPAMEWNALSEYKDPSMESGPHDQCRLMRSINPIIYLRHLLIKIDSTAKEVVDDDFRSATSNTLGRILELQNLLSVQIALPIAHKYKSNRTLMHFRLAAIAAGCKVLEEKLGFDHNSVQRSLGLPSSAPHRGLSVEVWPCVFYGGRPFVIHRSDITWMWKVPDDQTRKRVKAGVADQQEMFRVSIADNEDKLAERLQVLVDAVVW